MLSKPAENHSKSNRSNKRNRSKYGTFKLNFSQFLDENRSRKPKLGEIIYDNKLEAISRLIIACDQSKQEKISKLIVKKAIEKLTNVHHCALICSRTFGIYLEEIGNKQDDNDKGPFWEALIEKFLEKLLKYVRDQNYASKRLLKYDNWPKKDECRRMLSFAQHLYICEFTDFKPIELALTWLIPKLETTGLSFYAECINRLLTYGHDSDKMMMIFLHDSTETKDAIKTFISDLNKYKGGLNQPQTKMTKQEKKEITDIIETLDNIYKNSEKELEACKKNCEDWEKTLAKREKKRGKRRHVPKSKSSCHKSHSQLFEINGPLEDASPQVVRNKSPDQTRYNWSSIRPQEDASSQIVQNKSPDQNTIRHKLSAIRPQEDASSQIVQNKSPDQTRHKLPPIRSPQDVSPQVVRNKSPNQKSTLYNWSAIRPQQDGVNRKRKKNPWFVEEETFFGSKIVGLTFS